MTPQELKNSILQKAFTGKLSKQNESEYVECSNIDNKKNKKMKDYEFDLPHNWELSTLEGISNSIPSKKHQIKQSQVLLDGSFPVISQSNEFITGYYNDISKVYNVKDSVVVFGDHTTVVKHIDFDFVVGADGVKIFEPFSIINSKYLYYCLSFVTIGLDKIGGYRRHYKYIKDVAIPVPPLEEQKRIVEKIEELMPLVDEYEKNWEKLEKFNKEFPEDMKKSLLQEAIKGNLVEQRPEEGTGEELYKLIQEEKKKLIKEGKIKKQKDLPEIKENEMPFDIPESWKWVRLGDVINFTMGKTPPRSELQWWKPEIPWVSISDMEEDGFVLKTKEGISKEALDEKFNNNISPKGTLIMSFKLTVGRVSILEIDAVHNEAIISIYPFIDSDDIFKFYLFKILPFITKFGETKNAIKGKTLNSTSIKNLILPLPPLQEQKRIVEKLEELLPLCDQLIINK